MKKLFSIFAILLAAAVFLGTGGGQESKPAETKQSEPKPAQSAVDKDASGHAYAGMYTFLKEGEFLQLTVEDNNSVTGFISRFGDGESDKGAFLDQFFKTGKLDGNKLTFNTEVVHGVSFDFKGTVERGEGKNPGDEAYFVLKGTLNENSTDVNKKTTSHAREVALKMFPQDAAPAPVMRK